MAEAISVVPADPTRGIHPGAIFALRNIGADESSNRGNRLHPHYLVYLADDGRVVADHTEVKSLLDVIRAGCRPHEEPVAAVTRLFNAATSDGAEMGKYSELLTAAIRSMVDVTDERDLDSLFTAGGEAPPVGHPIADEHLAQTLEQIGEQGWQTVYTGDVARAIDSDMRERGGLLCAADLAAYSPVVRPALRSTLGDWDLACNPPPSIGGPVLTAMLRLLQTVEEEITPARAATVLKDVLDIRLDRIDTAEDLAAAGAELLETLHEIGSLGLPRSPSTAHVSVVDETGLACAFTASAGYSSGMTISGTGFMGNNALGELELNRLGVHALAPGTRLASNMAPTTARRADGTVLAIGTPGADRITTALAQVMTHLAMHGEDLQTAIDRPRMHPRRLDDGSTRIDHEQDAEIAASLDEAGLVRFEHDRLAMYFGGVGAAARHSDGRLEAGADPRRASATLVT